MLTALGLLTQLIDPGSSWTTSATTRQELIFVVLIALVCAGILRLTARTPNLAGHHVPLAVFFMLCFYELSAPWGLIYDYDTFLSDAVLTSVLFELLIPVFPIDPIGSTALALAALSMGSMIAIWGGPVRPKEHDEEKWAPSSM